MRVLARSFENEISHDGGFTLIEIVVASALASLIMLMVYTAYHSTLTSVKDMTGYSEMYENINLAVSKIDADLSNCYIKPENKKICFISLPDGENSKLNFVTVSFNEFRVRGSLKTPVPESDVHEVGYYLKQDPQYPGVFQLIKREEAHYDDEPESGGSENVLLEDVISLQFHYKVRNEWEDSWDSRDTSRFPSLVKTTIKVKKFGVKAEGDEDTEEFSFISYISMSS
jgi:general secretion pathway protein J